MNSEQLARRFLDGAKDRSQQHNSPMIRLRRHRFVEILHSAPHLITFERDHASSQLPNWPRFRPHYGADAIEVSNEVFA